jgi:serine carboxypeptidase-like clade 2
MISLLLVLLCGSAAVLGAPVTSLPGLHTPLPSTVDSGYITVDPVNGRALFYVFTASQRSEKDPLMIWFTGGPGCSSLIALFEEHGLFLMNFTANGTGITINPFAWNTVANVIYVESPAGVGFSYSNTTTDYTTGDLRTASDAYVFLQGFLAMFPQYRANPFWVIGESYGGHYVPEFAYFTAMKNIDAPAHLQINLRGIMAGNPWTSPEHEAFGVVDNWWDRSIISEAVWTDIHAYCSYQDITFWIVNNVTAATLASGDRFQARMASATTNQTKCFDALRLGSMVQFGGVSIEGIYLDLCNTGTRGDIPDQPNYCSDNQLTSYLNRMDVQQALHVRTPAAWSECSSSVHYSTIDTESSVLYAYRYFMDNTTMSILVYSGDNDAIVPFTGTRRWLKALNRPIVNDVHQWFADTNGLQVGGWAVQYDRLTFTTVRGAGHMVPFMQPQRALHMFRTFLENGTL